MAIQHEILINQVLLALGSEPDIQVWRTEVGLFRMLHSQRVITIGPVGMGDIAGVLAPHGQFFCVEVKTGNQSLRKSQIKFREWIERRGAVWVTAWSVDDALRGLAPHRTAMIVKRRARREAWPRDGV